MNASAVDYIREVKPIFAEHCYRCHGASQQKGDLRMDTAAQILKGGENGPAFESGKGEKSLLIQALKGAHESISQMPYKKPPLGEAQIALIQKWIDEGGQAPSDEQPHSAVHWSFIAPTPIAPPSSKSPSTARNTIDQFIQSRLEKENIRPSPEADRVTLLRRLSLDLIGLAPTPEEIDDFIQDKRPDAYERQVERLLNSPHYGERWGRWWLDAARYGDSNGYSIDAPRQIWKYRDWVVNALNRDISFDQFSIEQIAGDLLPNATIEQKIATGFNRNTQINQEGGIDPEQFRVESVMDRVNTFGTAFLGLTVGCAQCHDHKFDPIRQREYYQLYAFFNNTEDDGHGKGTPGALLEIPGEFESMEGVQKELAETRDEFDRFLNTKGDQVRKWSESLSDEARAKLPEETIAALKLPWRELSVDQKRAAYASFKPEDKEVKARNGKIAKLEKTEPKAITTLVMKELKEPRKSHLFINGDFTRPAEPVAPGTPAVLHPFRAENEVPNRLDLARWLVDPANPLLARVIVNRVWQQYFGKGLVETENDFGTQGIPPTHPELLDWLACEFIQPTTASAKPWSLKHVHRLVTGSATYRQSSRNRQDLLQTDSNNRLLARQNRLRLDAEIVRDVALANSGLLSRELGGPPVYPPQPDGVMSLGQVKRNWQASSGENRYRRALYTHLWRATPHPALSVFDAPDGFSSCTRRLRSNTPLQALTLLNDEQFFEFAQALGARIEKSAAQTDADKIIYGFRLCLGRTPTEVEQKRLLKLTSQSDADKWITVARVLLNLDETITRE
ncbi:MAG TPA: PSD1 and planctomycete cytochrome C domain-containing protein [Candidatus Kapabacteria bacterium]|nr:PSD1 and planctomycete cytochrome C domain-containing protein [Candidatus Kapabacteria bacterium]